MKITNYNDLVNYLYVNSDKKYDSFNNAIINSNVATIGCRIPFVRQLAKQFDVEDVSGFPTNEYVEIDLLKGIVISSCKRPFVEKSRLLTNFAETIENWAVCDCSTIKKYYGEEERYFDYFCDLTRNESTFVCRYGLVNLLSGFLSDTYIDAVFECFSKIKIWGEYYVDMASAWLVATSMVKCRDKTIAFLNGDARRVMSKFAYNKALQKMRDSYKISEDDKQWTYTIKIE